MDVSHNKAEINNHVRVGDMVLWLDIAIDHAKLSSQHTIHSRGMGQ